MKNPEASQFCILPGRAAWRRCPWWSWRRSSWAACRGSWWYGEEGGAGETLKAITNICITNYCSGKRHFGHRHDDLCGQGRRLGWPYRQVYWLPFINISMHAAHFLIIFNDRYLQYKREYHSSMVDQVIIIEFDKSIINCSSATNVMPSSRRFSQKLVWLFPSF